MGKGNIKDVKNNKTKLVLGLVSLIIFLLSISLTYSFNKNFKNKVDSLLGKMPGVIGEYFQTSLKEIGNQDKKIYLAEYYISLEADTAADKLYIIKKNDGKLYNNIVKLMNSISSSKTERIIKLVRDTENSNKSLTLIYNMVKNKKEEILLEEIDRFENQDVSITIKEIEDRQGSEQGFKKNLLNIMINMSQDKASDILYYMGADMRDKVLYSMDHRKRNEIKQKLSSKRSKETKLIDLSNLYEMKPVKIAVEEIGDTTKYSIDELGVIYSNLSVLKSARILSKLDDEFIEQLYEAIKNEEKLNGVEESIINDISKSIEFITEYNKKVDELVIVYEKMSANKAAKIVEKMMMNENTVTALEIDSEPVIEISDASIITDVLSRMGNKSLSNIMNYIDANKIPRLTQMLIES